MFHDDYNNNCDPTLAQSPINACSLSSSTKILLASGDFFINFLSSKAAHHELLSSTKPSNQSTMKPKVPLEPFASESLFTQHFDVFSLRILLIGPLTKRNIIKSKMLIFFCNLNSSFLCKLLLSESLHANKHKIHLTFSKREEKKVRAVQSSRKEGTDYISIKLIAFYRLPPKKNC